jgi:hypothetical protein
MGRTCRVELRLVYHRRTCRFYNDTGDTYMWPPPTIGDYYRAAIEGLRKEVEATPDDRVIGMNIEEWASYLAARYGMQPIVLDGSRSPEMEEVEIERTLRGYDIYSDRGPGEVARSTAVRVQVPVVPSDTIKVIWDKGLAPNTFHASRYPEFEYDGRVGCFSLVVDPGPGPVKNAIETITQSVRAYNESIENEDRTFRQQIHPILASKRARLVEKHKGLDTLSAAVGIPLKKRAGPATVVPTAPRVRTKIAPILPPASRPPTRPILERDKFVAILELLDNGCRQFERTPQAFRQLTEEGLRDVLLGNLNAVFEGAAGGETFQGIGKVDIHLRISQGEIFVAEVKFWDGPESLHTVIGQLRSRLTWRDAYGVALVLSRNAGFTDVLTAVRNTVDSIDGFVQGSLQVQSANHMITHFTIPSDSARHAHVHVLVYHLFVADPGRRVVRRRKADSR